MYECAEIITKNRLGYKIKQKCNPQLKETDEQQNGMVTDLVGFPSWSWKTKRKDHLVETSMFWHWWLL